MFTIARSNKRIKRLYIYNFSAAQPESEFDAGLTSPTGARRAAYYAFKRRLAGFLR